MSQTKPLVYLAGPITGMQNNEISKWREGVKQQLSHICIFDDPTSRTFHSSDNLSTAERKTIGKTVVTDSEISVSSADLILLNLKCAHRISIGSMIEVAWAAFLNKSIVVVIDKYNIHQSDLLLSEDCVSFVTDNLSDACAYIESFAKGEAAIHDRAFPISNSRSFNLLVQIIQILGQKKEPLILDLCHHSTVDLDAVFLLSLAYKMNVKSVLSINDNSIHDHAMIREITSTIKVC